MEPAHLRLRRGVTLMELLVVLAIIISIMGIVLTSQSSFNKTLLLANTAYDIALTLRSTENLGIGTLASGSTANAGRGTHFEKGTPGSFKLFADTYPGASCGTPNCKPGDHIYEDGTGSDPLVQDLLVQKYTLGNGITISDFCARNTANSSWACAVSDNLSSLDIVFARPNPDAFIRVNGDTGTVYDGACLSVTSLQGGHRFIRVAPSGEIIANASSCP